MSESVAVTLPLEILQKLQGSAAAMGIDLPGVANFAPTINVTQPIRNVALELGRAVASRDIYLRGGRQVGTVDPLTGDWKPMTARRFPGWCEEFVGFKAPGARRLRDSMGVEDAAQILEMDIFLSCLRPLQSIHTMILPVCRESGAVEFLAPGYDAESKIYTANVLKYPQDWSLEQGKAWLEENCAGYPWAWPTEERGELGTNRSFCAHVGVMLGSFCHALFPPGVRRPMATYLANQPGSGKSTLVAMVLVPVFGTADDTTVPKDDDKMKEELNALALNGSPYVFFDDIGGALFSHPLNAFVTASGRSSRILGGQERFSVKLATQVFCTGNDITVSDDLVRRAIVMELFLSTDAKGRKFAREISVEWLMKEEVRAKFLAALCAMVRHYMSEADKLPAEVGTAMASFEVYSRTISTIVQCAGYNDPMQAPEAGAASEGADDMRELLVKVATQADGDAEYDRKELVEFARGWNLLEPLVGATGDKDLDSQAMKKWGRQLQRWRGRELTDERGRKFRFSHKRQKRGAKYPLTFLKPPAT